MFGSTLRKVLAIFEKTTIPLTIRGISQQLNISSERAESMVQYWVGKGEIRSAGDNQDCSGCGLNGSCPFILEMPTSYELSSRNQAQNLGDVKINCERIL